MYFVWVGKILILFSSIIVGRFSLYIFCMLYYLQCMKKNVDGLSFQNHIRPRLDYVIYFYTLFNSIKWILASD